MAAYYDGTKLLSLKDIDGNDPEIIICTANRTAGKTTYFGRLSVRRFLKYQEQFCLLYRYSYELDNCEHKFFDDIGSLFFQGMTMESKNLARGQFKSLTLDGIPCGYAICLNSADMIKKYSHLFSHVGRIIFDEFQSETNKYLPNEVQKFISIHTSIARGQGEMVRKVPVIMISNPISIINPYYTALGISSRLRDDTHFLKGHGFVMEQGFNEAASEAQKSSGFMKAFADNQYTLYSTMGVYLNDSQAFIDTPNGKSRYVCTIRFKGCNYAVREYADLGLLYVDKRADDTFRTKIAVTTDDHQINYIMLKKNDLFIGVLREYFEKGCFRFKDLSCKEALMTCVSYL